MHTYSSIYRYEIVEGLANAIFSAVDSATGARVMIYQWTPEISQRETARTRLVHLAPSVEFELFSTGGSLFMVAESKQQAARALELLRRHHIFTGIWLTEAAAHPQSSSSPSIPTHSSPKAMKMAEFQSQLATWYQISFALPDKFLDWDAELMRLMKDVNFGANSAGASKVWEKFQNLVDEIMGPLIVKSDMDIDPGRVNRNLQSAINSLVLLGQLELIDPAKGTRPGPHLCRCISSVPSFDRGVKGTIHALVSRGFRHKNTGKVIRQADIVEFG